MSFKNTSLQENYNRIKNPGIFLNEAEPLGTDNNDDPIGWPGKTSNRPQKGDFVILKSNYPEYTTKFTIIDSTHVNVSRLTNGQEDPDPYMSRGTPLHIGQLRQASYYNDLNNWMLGGGKGELETKIWKDL